MNLFLDYQKKIFKTLKILEKEKKIKLSKNIKSFSVELPPKDQRAHMSCNVALILAKTNNTSPVKLAELLKISLLNHYLHSKEKNFHQNQIFQKTFFVEQKNKIYQAHHRFWYFLK